MRVSKFSRTGLNITLTLAMLVGIAHATDIPVPATRLLVIDRLAGTKPHKVVFYVRESDAGISKGAGIDSDAVSAMFFVAYETGTTGGAYRIPTGAFDGTAGWKIRSRSAKYTNRNSPAGLTTTRKTAVNNDRWIRYVAKDLGDDIVLDIFGAGPPAGSVYTAYCIDNASEWTCHCSEIMNCDYGPSARGTAMRLKCGTPRLRSPADSIGDPTCRGFLPTVLSAATVFDVDFNADCENTQ